jgi:hypothetical protein
MFSTDPATTRDLTLADVAERLARKTSVQALMTIGSSRDALQPAYSDYDLVIVLEGWPAEVRVGYTIIGSKLTDLLFVESAAITRILSAVEPLDPWSWDGRTVRWLQAGRIMFDRHGAVTRAQAKVRQGSGCSLQARLRRTAPGFKSTTTSRKHTACWPRTTLCTGRRSISGCSIWWLSASPATSRCADAMAGREGRDSVLPES